MYIKELNIAAFGPILDTRLTFDRGLNIIEGKNESGKTSVAMFVKFIFYGLSARTSDSVSERRLYVNRDSGVASGYAVFTVKNSNGSEREIRIERTVAERSDADGRLKYSERLRVLDGEGGMPIAIKGQPGEYFFGVPEQVFVSSVFASQGGVRPDSAFVREAVENMILAADEKVSVKRAVDSIDRERVRLMHKKGGGGEIPALEAELERTESELERAQQNASSLIKNELSLADVKEKLTAAKARCAQLEELSAAADTLSRDGVRRRISEEEGKLETLKGTLADASLVGADDSFRSTLAVAVRDIDRADKLEAEYKKKLDTVRESFPDGEPTDPEDDAEYAERMLRRRSNTLVPALILALAGAAAFAVAFVLHSGHRLFLPIFCSGALSFMVGVSMLILASAWSHEATAVFDDWGVDDLDGLRECASELGGIYRSLDGDKSATEAARAAAVEAETTMEVLLERAGLEKIEGESVRERARRLVIYSSECSKKKKELGDELLKLEGRLAADRSQLERDVSDTVQSSPELLERVGAMSEDERRELVRELRFTRTKIENLHGRRLELERECSAQRAVAADPSVLFEKKAHLTDEIFVKRRRLEAYLLATEALQTASENIRLSVLPRLTSAASDIMSGVTDGKYDELGISPAFDMNFRFDAVQTLELDFLSTGTREAAYLALRLALTRALYDAEHRPPMLLDESLSALDEDRVRRATALLAKSDMQIFLFTCRQLEAASVDGCHTVVMTERRGES